MHNKAYDQLSLAQERHWYHHGRRLLIGHYLQFIRQDLGRDLEILDAGCGTGSMFSVLKDYGKVIGLELSDYAISLCRKKYPEVLLKAGSVGDIETLFPAASFDVVTILNVLYHEWVQDESQVLQQISRVLKPGGYVILLEPAFHCLFRQNDRFCCGVRRYRKKDMARLLAQGGFSFRKSTYFNAVSFLPLLMVAQLERWGLIKSEGERNELAMPPGYVNGLMKFAMFVERLWIKTFGSMFFGVSILATGKKAAR